MSFEISIPVFQDHTRLRSLGHWGRLIDCKISDNLRSRWWSSCFV